MKKRIPFIRSQYLSLALLFLTIGLCLPFVTYSQVTVSPIAGHRPANAQHGMLTVPVVSGGTPSAVYAINTWLQTSLLDKAPGHTGSNPFDAKLPSTPDADGSTELKYRVYGNTRSYLSLEVDSRYRASSHNFDNPTFFNFDLRSGQPFILQEIFTDQGLNQLSTKVEGNFWSTLKHLIAPSSSATSGSPNAAEAAAVHLLTMCRDKLPRTDSPIVSGVTFLLSNEALRIDFRGSMTNCAPREPEQRVLESVGLLYDTVPLKDISDLLNPYGRCMLIEQRADCTNPRPYRYRRLLRGTIDGRSAMTVLLGQSALYFYDKIGTLIPLMDPLLENVMWTPSSPVQVSRWSALGRTYRPTEIFDLHTQPDGSLAGTWHQINPPVTLPMSLH